ncbi:MAG: alanine--tRNA ligase, partial [Pseudobutyrivibrio sp.]|nr:alanine--tRNA ligase [Pseudobutyrivibrio sp.]
GTFLAKLSETVINESKDGYPELWEKREYIFKTLTAEEDQFNKTIDKGLEILAKMEEEMVVAGDKVLSGENTFKLYDTYGFPVDLTAEILEEKGFSYDEAGFKACMEKQRQQARAARKETNYMGADATVYNDIDLSIVSEFAGYDRTSMESEITCLTTETEIVDTLAEGMIGTIIVPKTCFYATMGGQIGDTGVISTPNGEFEVKETIKLVGGKIGHVGVMTSGMIKLGDKVTLSVNEDRRGRICKNHSATHLLQKALREVLGNHVEQKGSNQDDDRTRFDFSHFEAMTSEEIAKVEEIVNAKIAAGLDIVTKEMTIDEAKKTGAMALFGEKYGETVRVVNMGDWSVELCGGTHAKNTSEIGAFKILSESGVAAGTRRIEAITSQAVFDYYDAVEEKLNAAASALKCKPAEVADKIAALQKQLKEVSSELESMKAKAASAAVSDVMDSVVDIKGVKLLATSVAGVDMNGLRDLGDELKGKLADGIVVLASECDGKVNLMVMATDSALAKGAHAGNLIKAIAPKVGGGGGGRPNMAQAGGKNPAGIADALNEAKSVLESQIQ